MHSAVWNSSRILPAVAAKLMTLALFNTLRTWKPRDSSQFLGFPRSSCENRFHPAAGVLAQGTILHRQRLLVVAGHARVQADAKRSFPPASPLAKTPARFGEQRGPFGGHFPRTFPPGQYPEIPAKAEIILL